MDSMIFGMCSEFQQDIRKTIPAETVPILDKLDCMSYSAKDRREALLAFVTKNGIREYRLEQIAGVAPGILRAFRMGRTDSLTNKTYEKLAAGASKLLARRVTMAELTGEERDSGPLLPLNYYVGAGDEVHIIDGNDPIDYIESPPSFKNGAAARVKGASMIPIFEEGDILFFRRPEAPPKNDLPARAVIVKVKDGPLFVKKLLPGTKKHHFHLISVNPHTPAMLDQHVESIARIYWVCPRVS